jgi:hypothetical protein
MKRNSGIVLLGFALLLIVSMIVPGPASADNDAMDYVAAPPGTKLAIFYYRHISANKLYSDGSKISDDANLSANIGILRGVYYTKLGPLTIDPQFLLPFGQQDLDGAAFGNSEISAQGLADLILTATIWFIDDPKSKTWLGFTPFIFIPIGDYDEDRALNLGENRWSFKPEFGFAKGFDKWHIDLTAALQFYGDNDDFMGNSTLEQDPLLTLEGHLTYKFTATFNATLDYFYHMDGETTVAGVDRNDEKDDHILGASFTWWLTPQYQLLLQYQRAVEVENGLKTDTVGMRFLHAF